MKRSNRITFAIFIVVLIGASCDLPTEPGPLPTTIIETEFKPGLNILGVLRLDDSTGTSFIHVEQACRTNEIYDVDFPLIIEDAEVIVKKIEDTTIYLFEADIFRPYVYTHPGFIPTDSVHYAITITTHTHPELPTLTDTTIVPVKPSIDSTALAVSEDTLSFDLLTTTDTDLYDIYLYLEGDILHQRLANQVAERRPVRFDLSTAKGQPLWIEIYGYDANPAEYLTAVTTIKYQTYLETVTTVTNGYGVFGSVSVAKFGLVR